MRPAAFLLILAACAPETPRGSAPTQAPEAPTQAPEAPPEAPSAVLAALIGEYLDGSDTLSVLERDGRLRLFAWGDAEVALERISDSLFLAGPGDTVRFAAVPHPPGGSTTGSAAPGTATPVALSRGGRSFARLALGAADGGTFRIVPLRPAADLLAEALAASPPAEEGDFLESDLVELVTLDPTIRLDVRYATTNNFMGEVFYSQARAFLQRPAAEALVRAHRWLAERGYGLLIHDGYRPWYVTKMFWEATPEQLRVFVADPAQGSRHNRGCAVDLTLFDRATGEPVEMPGGYDEMSPRSYPTYAGGTGRQRWHRELLREAMEAQGFTVYEAEWWHFDYKDWRRYRIGNQRFEELGS